MSSENKVVLEVRSAKTGEETPEMMAQVFSSLFAGGYVSYLRRLWVKVRTLSFEIAAFDQAIHFYAVIPESYKTFLESQISSQYPKILISSVNDYIGTITKSQYLALGNLRHASPFYYPIRTYDGFKDLDPLSSIIGVLSKLGK